MESRPDRPPSAHPPVRCSPPFAGRTWRNKPTDFWLLLDTDNWKPVAVFVTLTTLTPFPLKRRVKLAYLDLLLSLTGNCSEIDGIEEFFVNSLSSFSSPFPSAFGEIGERLVLSI